MGRFILGAPEKVMAPVVVLIGPSGAGKSSVAKVLQETHGFHLQKTVTTRLQRDEYDTDHIFVSDTDYDKLLREQAFFGTLVIFGQRYGLPRFDPAQKTLLLLRAPAINEFKTRFPHARIFEIDAPLEVLEKRLIARGTADRIVLDQLNQEMSMGQTLADEIIDSSKLSITEIAKHIADLLSRSA